MKKKINRLFIPIFVGFIILCILLALRNINVKLEYEITKIKAEKEDLIKRNQFLKMKYEELSSVERLESIARKRGFVPLTKERILTLK